MKKNKPKYNQIIEAAVEVIAENGYHASQVSKIAKKAGVADGTIYLYFKNKEDILISVFEEKMGQFIAHITEAIENKNNADEKLFELIKLHFRQLSEDHHLAIVTQLELRQSNPSLRLQINNVLKPYLNVIDSIIKEGMQEEIFRNSLNVRLVRQMIFGTLDETVTNWVMKDRKYNLVEQATEVHTLLTEGLHSK
ncbi:MULTISPECIES: TetR/AcrR family transcriptional regulator [Virgibacillus]|uniref:TetR family transcriptional regulator n=1 Tax=Virgibacillus pantothenticus TaxID=1473 RepID=A0A0L0QQA3_VIRPA|nr:MULTISPECIES: TetR/AcrR family transcriptional regulator [Virgibacillus]API90784.1 TetR family transcriptional regulator [Virgibacillus sp. 6R]KNE20731.1 TetR family transcriptional regulator [Virgibacillus pantothenticus]MBS7426788.1 TetR/AcrR family transcriptional regulator [Virgibacillus sp. 19R1-5]MBU8566115.1 TetR family transcriptional regulator [Virgibacillus pantothenticus]MBU8600589.1 TetR family transcriptional regulator [Virgibacillus pantothenticus]